MNDVASIIKINKSTKKCQRISHYTIPFPVYVNKVILYLETKLKQKVSIYTKFIRSNKSVRGRWEGRGGTKWDGS